MAKPPEVKPTVFVASSNAQRNFVNAITLALSTSCEVHPWFGRDVFDYTSGTLDSLLAEAQRADFGIFVCTPDEKTGAVRDNVVLELGIFLGKHGPKRCFILTPKDVKIHIPFDLFGITLVEYAPIAPNDPRPIWFERLIKAISTTWANATSRLCQEVNGDWLQIKLGTVERPCSIVTFSGPSAETLEISGVSYTRSGESCVEWPGNEINLRVVKDDLILHAFNSTYIADGRAARAIGVTSYTFFPASRYNRGEGYYATYSDGDVIASGRVDFWLRKITEQYKERLIGKMDAQAHWKPHLARAAAKLYGSKRVVITGGTYSGKSSLVEHLSKRDHAAVLREAAIGVINEKQRKLGIKNGDPEWKVWKDRNNNSLQMEILEAQLRLERSMDFPRGKIVFMDRSGIDCIAHLDANSTIPAEMEDYGWDSRFDAIVVCETVSPFVVRGDRTTSSPGDSEEMGRRLSDLYRRFGYEPILLPSIPLPEGAPEATEGLMEETINKRIKMLFELLPLPTVGRLRHTDRDRA